MYEKNLFVIFFLFWFVFVSVVFFFGGGGERERGAWESMLSWGGCVGKTVCGR